MLRVRHAVDRRFHPAGAARLERLARVVQPHVAALHEEVRDVQIVVVDEGDASAEQRIERALVDALQMVLADIVGRMRLAGEDDLDRPAGRVEDPRQPLRIVKHEFRPLVAGEAPREADRQRVGFEQRAGGDDARNADVLFHPALPRAIAHEGEEVAAQRLPHRPQLLVRNRQHRRPTSPDRRDARASRYRGSVQNSCDSSPAIQVGTWTPLVTDVTGRSASGRSGHIGAEHVARHLAVQPADRVGRRRPSAARARSC